MTEGREIGPLISKRDKAVAVPALKVAIIEVHGEKDQDAQEIAVHEFRHAVKDNKLGIYVIPKNGGFEAAEYQPIGSRSKEEVLRILKGPGKDMSTFDMMEEELLQEPPGFVKFIFKILNRLGF